MPLTVQIVDPEVDRGRPPRDIKMRDIIIVPVTYSRGNFPLRDMLNLSSVEALWVAHNRAQAVVDARAAVKRAPAKRRQYNRA